MQALNWNDLRYLLAIKRGRTLSGAARLLDVDDTTVSRRLGVLRSVLEDELCRRQRDGSLLLTEMGLAVASHTEAMEREADLIGELLGSEGEDYTGTVRITSVPLLVNRWLAPRMNHLLHAHPKLQIELLPDSRDFDLNLREADIAVRLARPVAGGSDTLLRRIGSLQFAVFASRCYSPDECAELPWIGYEDNMAHLPQARWIAKIAKRDQSQLVGLRVHDVETAMEAVLAGIGKSLLPTMIAKDIRPLQRLSVGSQDISREVWLLTHRSQHAYGRIKVVTEWIESLMKSDQSQ